LDSLVDRYRHHILLFAGLAYIHMCICGYYKYHNELFYKALICAMVVIWSCCHDVFLLMILPILAINFNHPIGHVHTFLFQTHNFH